MSNSTPTTTSGTASSTENPTILLLTHARTASHVLQRMLSKQPNVLYGSHFYITGRLQRRELLKAGPLHTTDPAIQADLLRVLNEGHVQLEEFLAEARSQEKTALVHTQPHAMASPQEGSDYIYGSRSSDTSTSKSTESAVSKWLVGSQDERHSNPTVVPDSVFLRPGTIPIFNFRHPLLVVDGVYRGMQQLPAFHVKEGVRPLISMGANLHWQRVMYDWYLDQGKHPLVLDADDYLGPEKQDLMRELCQRIPGFDADAVIYSWPKATAEEMAAWPEAARQSQQTISGSEGVMEGFDSRGRSLDDEVAKWTAKYGEEDACFLKGLVESAMGDYEYLRERRLRPDGTTRSK